MKKPSSKVFLFIFFFCLLVGVGLAFTSFNPAIAPQSSPKMHVPETSVQPTGTISYNATLEGEVVCLPHKDTSGPQTLECGFGLKADDGAHYALDAGGVNPPPYTTGQRIRANGLVTPVEMLSSDHWQKYNIKGIFSIKDTLEVL